MFLQCFLVESQVLLYQSGTIICPFSVKSKHKGYFIHYDRLLFIFPCIHMTLLQIEGGGLVQGGAKLVTTFSTLVTQTMEIELKPNGVDSS